MDDTTKRRSRRDFLKLAGTALPAAAVAVATGGEAAEASEAPPQGSDLRMTDHIRTYLDTARF
mgnify:CR=1 FL=1